MNYLQQYINRLSINYQEIMHISLAITKNMNTKIVFIMNQWGAHFDNKSFVCNYEARNKVFLLIFFFLLYFDNQRELINIIWTFGHHLPHLFARPFVDFIITFFLSDYHETLILITKRFSFKFHLNCVNVIHYHRIARVWYQLVIELYFLVDDNEKWKFYRSMCAKTCLS